MENGLKIALSATAILFLFTSAPLSAEETDDAGTTKRFSRGSLQERIKDRRESGETPVRDAARKRYDKNNDGVITGTEREAMTRDAKTAGTLFLENTKLLSEAQKMAIQAALQVAVTTKGQFEGTAQYEHLQKLKMQKLDTNGDGTISDEEYAAGRKILKAKAEKGVQKTKDAAMVKYDTNKDGVIDDNEAKAAVQQLKAKSLEARDVLLTKYDANGNGMLDEAELQAMQADIMAAKDLKLDSADKNNDGKIDENEAALAAAQMALNAHDLYQHMDQDGDGELSPEELSQTEELVEAAKNL